jgi:hypothetical protein
MNHELGYLQTAIRDTSDRFKRNKNFQRDDYFYKRIFLTNDLILIYFKDFKKNNGIGLYNTKGELLITKTFSSYEQFDDAKFINYGNKPLIIVHIKKESSNKFNIYDINLCLQNSFVCFKTNIRILGLFGASLYALDCKQSEIIFFEDVSRKREALPFKLGSNVDKPFYFENRHDRILHFNKINNDTYILIYAKHRRDNNGIISEDVFVVMYDGEGMIKEEKDLKFKINPYSSEKIVLEQNDLLLIENCNRTNRTARIYDKNSLHLLEEIILEY